MYNRGMNDTLRANELSGKKVLSSHGKEIGKIKEICIDKDSWDFRGIIVHRGIIEQDLYVGKNYIQDMGKDSVLLKVVPYTEYPSMRVIDSKGKEVGRVKKVHRAGKSNHTVSMIIDRGLGKKDLVIQEDEVSNIGETVVLNHPVEEAEA